MGELKFFCNFLIKLYVFFKNKPYLCSQKVKHKTHTAMTVKTYNTRKEAHEAAFHFQMFDAHCTTCRTEIEIQKVVLVFNTEWETIAVFKWSDHIPTLSELIAQENAAKEKEND